MSHNFNFIFCNSEEKKRYKLKIPQYRIKYNKGHFNFYLTILFVFSDFFKSLILTILILYFAILKKKAI